MTSSPEGRQEAAVALLPCPFCGSKYLMGQEPHDNHPVAGKFYLYHDYGPLGSPARKCPIDVRGHFDSEADAIAAWNRRALIPAKPAVEVVEVLDEVTEDEIRSRAKNIIRRNGWLEQKAPPQLHSIIELMVTIGLDVLKNRPASCGYPGCGCAFDAVCNAALQAPATPDAQTEVEK